MRKKTEMKQERKKGGKQMAIKNQIKKEIKEKR
jgi:hypothetical protein